MRWHVSLMVSALVLMLPVASASLQASRAFPVGEGLGKIWIDEYCMDPPEKPIPEDCCPTPHDILRDSPVRSLLCGWGTLVATLA